MEIDFGKNTIQFNIFTVISFSVLMKHTCLISYPIPFLFIKEKTRTL